MVPSGTKFSEIWIIETHSRHITSFVVTGGIAGGHDSCGATSYDKFGSIWQTSMIQIESVFLEYRFQDVA